MVVFILSSLIFVPYILRGKIVDCVIAFFTIPSGIAAWLMSKIKRCRLIISLRGGDVPRIPVPDYMPSHLEFYYKITKPIIRFLWIQSRFVVANSVGLKQLALKTAPNRAIEVIPNGIDLNSWLEPKILPRNGGEKFIVLTEAFSTSLRI